MNDPCIWCERSATITCVMGCLDFHIEDARVCQICITKMIAWITNENLVCAKCPQVPTLQKHIEDMLYLPDGSDKAYWQSGKVRIYQ